MVQIQRLNVSLSQGCRGANYPKTEEGWEELGKRVATAHANYVIEKIERLNCPTWQKLELYQAVIDTTKGTYKPKEHQKPGWQPSRYTKPHAQHMLFCSDQALK